MPAVLYSAAVLCPMNGPPLEHGGVLVDDGRIVAVGAAADLQARAARSYHYEGVLLPGLVNGHTQVEHHDAARLARPGPFPAWARAVAGATATWSRSQWTRSARRGVLRLLRTGTTAVADMVVAGPAVPALSRARLSGDSLLDIRMVDAREQEAVLAAVDRSLDLPAEGRTVGIAAHALYSVGTTVLRALADLAGRRKVPLYLRAAESNAELIALRSGDGPLADLARQEGMAFEWLPNGVNLGPGAYLERCGVLRPGTVLVHGVWLDLADARRLAANDVAVVVCPQANAMLGVGQAPLERFAEAGTPLALGTGSPAAVGASLDLLAAAAAWVELGRDRGLAAWPSPAGPVPLEEQAVRLATIDGARALGWGDRAGSLEPGRPADLCGIAIDTDVGAVYRDLIARGPGRQVVTVIGGVRMSRRESADRPWPDLADDEPDRP